MSYWLNIDYPTNIVRLHREECRWCKPSETPLKGVGVMKQDGGWLSFNSYKEAHIEFKKNYSNMNWKPCKTCRPS